MTQKRLQNELMLFVENPSPNFTAGLIDPSNPRLFRATINGPEGSPYEGGIFNLEITLT